MDFRVICRFLGRISIAEAVVTIIPMVLALIYREKSFLAFSSAIVIMSIVGLCLVRYGQVRTQRLTIREGIAITGLGWLLATALGMIPYVGTPILTFGIVTFAFSTILGWSYYGERAMEYLAGKRSIVFYRVVFILLVFAGSTMSLALVWNLADIMNALMAIPNLISLLLLSGVMAKETQHYLWNKHLDDEDKEVES